MVSPPLSHIFLPSVRSGTLLIKEDVPEYYSRQNEPLVCPLPLELLPPELLFSFGL